MARKNANKAWKAINAATMDIWESRWLVGGDVMKKEAKRSNNRAQRRLDKALIREQING